MNEFIDNIKDEFSATKEKSEMMKLDAELHEDISEEEIEAIFPSFDK